MINYIAKKWENGLKCLANSINRIQPLAGVGIAIEQLPNGRKINVIGGNGGGGGSSDYDGYFTIQNTSTESQQIATVVNGSNTGSSICGSFVTDQEYTVDKQGIVITQSVLVYLHIMYDTELKEYSGDIVFVTEIPTKGDNEAYYLIGQVTYSDGEISNIEQVWQDGVIYVITGYWS